MIKFETSDQCGICSNNHNGLTYNDLKHERDYFESLQNTLGDAVFTLNIEQRRIKFVNKSVETVFGYKPEECVGRLTDIFYPDHDSFLDFGQKLRNAMTTGKDTLRTEHVLKRKSGELFPALITTTFLKHENEIKEAISIIHDITDRKRREDRLRMLSCAVEQNPTSIVITDSSGIVQYVNPRFTVDTGYAAEEVIGKSMRILKSGLHSQEFYRKLWGAILSGNIWRGDICNRKKNGKLFWELLSISPVKNEAGDITNFIAIKIDDTERKQAEEALRRSEASLLNAQRIAGIGNWDWDIVNNTLYWSNEIYRIFGIKPGEFGATYEAFLNFVHPSDRESVKKAVNDAVYHKKSYGIEHRIILPDNKERVIYEQAEVTCDEHGHPVRMSGTMQDITDRRRLEDDLLTARKLESLGILAGGIAHDFNNMLTGILGNISLVKAYANLDNRMERILSEAEKASFRAKDLTQQLLTFAKGGAPVKKVVALNELIAESVSFALSGSNVRHEISMPDDLWHVEADEGQINQVVNNLVLNAGQAMPDGGVVEIVCSNLTPDTEPRIPFESGRYVRITVRDCGCGIPKEYLQKIFDPYFTTKQKGSGLGLTSVYSIIKNHDGYINVESEPGKGTAFNIYLPATEKKTEMKTVAEGKASSGCGKVLIMDDEELIRMLVSEALANAGYEVECAADGAQAVGLYRKAKESGAPFDAVIMDLTIPGSMGGKEAIKNLMAIDPAVKAIVSSGYSNDPVMSDYRKFGFSGVITKPYRISDLSNIVSEMVGKG